MTLLRAKRPDALAPGLPRGPLSAALRAGRAAGPTIVASATTRRPGELDADLVVEGSSPLSVLVPDDGAELFVQG
ncbi:hypothetical protein ACWEBX_02165 [Streptomyces sp. NPDC005070]